LIDGVNICTSYSLLLTLHIKQLKSELTQNFTVIHVYNLVGWVLSGE